MAESGGQPGNRNAVKGKRWEEALRRALARVAAGDLNAGLDKVADKVVADAIQGATSAWQEIANRLDGKATEHVLVDQETTVLLDDVSELRPRLQRVLAGRKRNSVQ